MMDVENSENRVGISAQTSIGVEAATIGGHGEEYTSQRVASSLLCEKTDKTTKTDCNQDNFALVATSAEKGAKSSDCNKNLNESEEVILAEDSNCTRETEKSNSSYFSSEKEVVSESQNGAFCYTTIAPGSVDRRRQILTKYKIAIRTLLNIGKKPYYSVGERERLLWARRTMRTSREYFAKIKMFAATKPQFENLIEEKIFERYKSGKRKLDEQNQTREMNEKKQKPFDIESPKMILTSSGSGSKVKNNCNDVSQFSLSSTARDFSIDKNIQDLNCSNYSKNTTSFLLSTSTGNITCLSNNDDKLNLNQQSDNFKKLSMPIIAEQSSSKTSQTKNAILYNTIPNTSKESSHNCAKSITDISNASTSEEHNGKINNFKDSDNEKNKRSDSSKKLILNPVTSSVSVENTTNDTQNHLIVALLDRSDPLGKISLDKWKKIEVKLLNLMIKHMDLPGQLMPSFNGNGWIRGVKILMCNDEFTLEWCKEAIKKITDLWEGALLEIVDKTQIPSLPRAKVFIPLIVPPETMLRLLQKQNPTIPTSDWKILKISNRQNGGQDCILQINKTAEDLLYPKFGKMAWGLDTVYLRLKKQNLTNNNKNILEEGEIEKDLEEEQYYIEEINMTNCSENEIVRREKNV